MMNVCLLLGTALLAQSAGDGNAIALPPTDPACGQCERSLQLRADALDARAQEIAARDAHLQAEETALKNYKAGFQTQVEALLTRIAALEKQLDIGEGARQAREQRMTVLTETLTTLSAKKAAPMLATADPELVGDLLLRIGAARSAALLALMPPNRAARFLEEVRTPTVKSAAAGNPAAVQR
jgi:flagellar motility protein MotE (MotC chaperone)